MIIFLYVISWLVILYYMINRNMRHVMHVVIPIILIILNGTLLVIQLETSHVNFIKIGAATEAVLLFILVLNIADCARCT